MMEKIQIQKTWYNISVIALLEFAAKKMVDMRSGQIYLVNNYSGQKKS